MFLHRGRVLEQTPAAHFFAAPPSQPAAPSSPARSSSEPTERRIHPCCAACSWPPLLALPLPLGAVRAEDKFIIVQSTTSTEQSGLFGHILPLFQDKTGIEVRVVAVGTGQAIKNAQNGDGDVLFVHAKPDEEKFVAEG